MHISTKTHERPDTYNPFVKKPYRYAQRYTKNKNVLDVGCGFGFGTYDLALHNARHCLGIDREKNAISYARAHYSLYNLTFKTMDVFNISFLTNKFDVIIAFELIEHFPPERINKFFYLITKQLTPTGKFILSTPNKFVSSANKNKPNNPYHQKEYLKDELHTLCDRYFSHVIIKGMYFDNDQFIETGQEINSTLRGKFTKIISRYKIIHNLLPYIPVQIKNSISLHNRYLNISDDDVKIRDNKIDVCPILIAICSKKKHV